ncbi:hypothetical protein [Mycobacteroides abscessus]|uniref:hypothetical protein n=1 Tax=Mycobacteroides abscessus TaxID=36809 RepID=UPI0012FFE096|nr:hypothetical protein [Mycobacteroides abscessus]
MPNYSGNNSLPPLNQNGFIDINNPAQAQQAPAQAAQNAPAQNSGQPLHGQQPPAYDNAPGQIQQQPRPNPDQQQQPVQQNQQQQQPNQQDQQQQQQQQDKERDRQCSNNADRSWMVKRALTKAEQAAYDYLREQTPKKSGLKKKVADRDGIPVSDEWQPDHVISLRILVQFPGFVGLNDKAAWLAIADSNPNTYALEDEFNSSKGAKSPTQWGGKVKKSGNEMSPEEFAEFCKQEEKAIQHIQEEVANRQAQSKGEEAPDKSVTRAPERPQKPKAPTKADSIPQYDSPPSTSEIWQRQYEPNYLQNQSTKLLNEFNSLEHDINWLNTDANGNMANADSYLPPADAAKADQLRALQLDVAKSWNLVNGILNPPAPPPAPTPPSPPPPSFLQRVWNWWSSPPSIPIIPVFGPGVPVPVP